MQQLTLNKLKDYNLFSDLNNKLILTALFNSISEIKVYLRSQLPQDASIKLFNHYGEQLSNLKIAFSEDQRFITIKGNFKLNQNYITIIDNEKSHVFLNPEINGILDSFFFGDEKDFGVSVKNTTAKFKLWSPPAVKAELILYDKNQNKINISNPIYLKNTKPGIWEYHLKLEDSDLNNFEDVFYQYKITAYGKEYISLDPYSKSMVVFDANSDDKIGKGTIIDFNSKKAIPPNFKKTYNNFKFIENETDVIAYELNIRDFTIQPGIVDEKIAGTFKGFIENIDYLKELGITHVQLMPITKAYTQNELKLKYTDKTAKESNYNWGYDPMSYFTLEGRYSTNSYDPYTRIYEFKEMVQALHDKGIGVILDVVFNHTYIADTFENIAPGCYYRLNDDYKLSGHTGAGATLESRRKQVRKFFIDVLKFYVSEYHIDGFRFDLMSFTDKETMHQIRKEVGFLYNSKNENELILHGEAWNFTDLKENAVIKTDFESINIGIFNDTFRDSVVGNGHSLGFIQGNTGESSRMASAIIGGINTFDSDYLPFNMDIFFDPYNLFAKEPGDCLNFLSVHDGLTLWDKINLSFKDESKKERLQLMKFAYAILFTSQGKIILHGGDEILRTKPLADFDYEKHRALTSQNIDFESDTEFFHENSYCSNDYTNMFRWDRLTNEYSEFAGELLEYVKALVKMRRKISAFRLNTSSEINKSIKFINEDRSDENLIHSFKSHLLNKLTLKFKNGIPGEKYYLVGEIHKGDPNPINNLFVLKFDMKGFAKITFNKRNITDFDIPKWDKSQNLNIKLVKTPGSWDYPKNSYTEFGHNSICPKGINENFEVEIDLNIVDFKNKNGSTFLPTNYIAFIITNHNIHINLKKKDYNFKKIIVIHNPSPNSLKISLDEITDPKKWHVILDLNRADINGLRNSSIIIEKKTVIIPKKSSGVIVSNSQ